MLRGRLDLTGEHFSHDAAQPPVALIDVLRAVPILLDVERRDWKGWWQHLQVYTPAEHLADRLRDQNDEIGRRNDHRKAKKVSRMQHLSSVNLVLPERRFNDSPGSRRRIDNGVRQFSELPHRQVPLNRRMPGPYDTDIAVSKQKLLKDVRAVDVGKIADRQIDGPRLHCRHQ